LLKRNNRHIVGCGRMDSAPLLLLLLSMLLLLLLRWRRDSSFI
jgi:hypothetical protein